MKSKKQPFSLGASFKLKGTARREVQDRLNAYGFNFTAYKTREHAEAARDAAGFTAEETSISEFQCSLSLNDLPL